MYLLILSIIYCNCKFCFSFGSVGKKLKESVKITSSTTLWRRFLKNTQVNRFLEYDFKNNDEIVSDIYYHAILYNSEKVWTVLTLYSRSALACMQKLPLCCKTENKTFYV